MKGYQLTRSDLEFIEKMKEEKLIKKLQVTLAFSLAAAAFDYKLLLGWHCADAMGYSDCPQGDLEVVQRLLKKEMMAAELACASREKAQAELKTVGLLGDEKTTQLVLFIFCTSGKTLSPKCQNLASRLTNSRF